MININSFCQELKKEIDYESEANSDQDSESSSEALNLVSAGYAGAGAAPKINLKTYKFTALVGKQELDFYLFNSVPTVIPKLRDDDPNTSDEEKQKPAKRYLSNDILQQVGGLLNVSLGKVSFFGYGDDPEMKYIKGFQSDVRLGIKLLEAPFENKSEYFPALQSYLDLRYLIPLQDKKLKKQGLSQKESLVGNLSFRLVGGVQQFFGGKDGTYSTFFTTHSIINTGGSPMTLFHHPKLTLIVGNFEGFFYLTNKVYISAGYNFSNDTKIDSYPYFSISYGSK